MKLTELSPGEVGILLSVPHTLLPFSLRPGNRISMVMTRPELSVVDADGARFALAGELARQIIITGLRA